MSQPVVVYTVGHSDHTSDELLALLRRHDIACLVDVRSQPYSRWAHQFNREILAHNAQQAGLAYHFMGDVLGGRPADRSLYDPGQERPDYDRVEQMPAYQEGIERALGLAQERRIALMCSEGDHRQCHRHMLITQTLMDRGVEVRHIQPDGSIVLGERIPRQLSLFG